MSQYSRLRTPLFLALATSAAATLAACGGGDEKADALTQDSSLSRDLAMAGQQDSVAQPQLQDVPVAPAPEPTPVTPAPAPTRPTRTTSGATTVRNRPATPAPRPSTPAPAAPRTTPSGNTVTSNAGGGASERGGSGTIESGSTLTLASNSKVCTNTNRVGERFSATVAETVSGSNGASIPAGATATVEITELSRSENARDKIEMGFRVVSVTFGGNTYQLDGTTQSADISRVRNQPAAKDRQKVIGGAIAGAIAGQILGKDTKGTIIGAAAGAAAGAGAAAATANYEGCLNSGGRLAIRLTDAVQVRM